MKQPNARTRAAERLRHMWMVVLVGGAMAAAEVTDSDTRTDSATFVPGRLIVRFDPAPADVVAQRRAALPGARHTRTLLPASQRRTSDTARDGPHLVHIVELQPGKDVTTAARKVGSLPGVRYAEPDYIVRTTDTVPNDPDLGSLWGLHNTGQTGGLAGADIGALQAWDITTGSEDTVVAVIDTGVDYNHPDLWTNIWINWGERGNGQHNDGIDNDNNGYVDDVFGYDFLLGDPDPMDAAGHGTHVAGTIAAMGNNNLGVVGVNWRARIMALRFLGANGSGTTSAAAEALYYAIDNGAAITCNSWGGGSSSETFLDALVAARDAGVLFVAAAGNASGDNDVQPHYPSSYDVENVIAVAGTDSRDELSTFSSWGFNSVDLGAPGTDIVSTVPPFVTLFEEDFQTAQVPSAGQWFTMDGSANYWGTVDDGDGNTSARGDWEHANPYLPGADGSLVSPPLSTTGLNGLSLSFSYRYDMERDDDALIVDVWDGSDWVEVFRRSRDGNLQDHFFSTRIDLEPYRDDEMRVRFRWVTDDDGSDFFGAEVDDISIRYVGSDHSGPNAYGPKSGTSMATPHVAGVAALVSANEPALCMTAMKARLVWTGDPLATLASITRSGRRLNAHRALTESNGLIVEQPGGDQSWLLGSTHAITWSRLSCESADGVDIYLLRNGAVADVPAIGAPDTGSFEWTVPADLPAGAGYTIRMFSGAQSAVSNGILRLVEPIVLHVDDDAPAGGNGSDWATALLTIEDALAAADIDGAAVTEIHIAAGIYRPTIRTDPEDPRTATFRLVNDLTLRGGFAGLGAPDPNAHDPSAFETILSGDLDGNDTGDSTDPSRQENCYHVVTAAGVNATATLSGMTITAGNANGTGTTDDGGGLFATGTDLTLIECTFARNSATRNGGAIYNLSGDPTLVGCVFVANGARYGAGLYNTAAATPALDGCVFIDNQAEYSGGGVYSFGNAVGAVLSDCLFVGNHGSLGGGLRDDGSSTVLRNCRFIGNTAVGGGGGFHCSGSGAHPSLSGCVFIGNAADDNGGGMHLGENCAPALTNSTIAANTALRGAGAYVTNAVAPALTGNIVWSNLTTDGLADESSQIRVLGSDLTVDYSCVQGWSGTLSGAGSIGAAPAFAGTSVGTWTASAVYDGTLHQTTLVDATAAWSVNELAQRTVNVNTSQPLHASIASNTATTITAWGDLTALGAPGAEYEILDIHLTPDSPCINGGDPAFVPSPGETDMDGEQRLRGCRVDMGADETAVAGDGDGDGDGDVDLTDFAALQVCFGELAGAGGENSVGCLCAFDFDDSAGLDLHDFAAFLAAASASE